MSQAAYTVYDIETTGLSAACQCEIIEFAGIKLDEDLNEIDRLHIYVKPYKKLPKKIVELTGITNEQLVGCENRFQVLPKIRRFIGDTISVAHNAQFDFNFISTMCLQQNLPILRDYICTMKSYKAVTGEKTAKLSIACDHFGIELIHAHTAIADVEATVKLFRKLCAFDNGEGKKLLHRKHTNDRDLYLSLMGAICSQNPNKKVRELLCSIPFGSDRIYMDSIPYTPINVQTVVNMFEAAKDPVQICADLNYDFKLVSDLFAIWLNSKRMPRFIYLEDTQINRQVQSMIEHCNFFDDLIEMHQKLYETRSTNLGVYVYFWIKNKGSVDQDLIDRGIDLLFDLEYPIEKIIDVFPHLHPCDITIRFCKFAEANKSSHRQYIAESLCKKGDLDQAMELCSGHITDDQIKSDPNLIKVAVACALFDRGFFAIKKS